MITLEELQTTIIEIISQYTHEKKTENISLDQALGRVLSTDIISNIDMPVDDVSAMDGYALNLNIENNHPMLFKIIGESIAGQPYLGHCGANECIRIMTGAVIPQNCNTVIMQENIILENNMISLVQEAKYGANIRRRGEEIQKGQKIFSTGEILNTATIMVLASLGIAEVKVVKKPKVAVISSGDELIEIGHPLKKQGQIYDSNRHMILAKLKTLPVELIDYGIVKDDFKTITQCLTTASQEADIVITSGGVSVGDYDFLKEALKQLGVIHQYKVAMKPGKPFVFGQIKNAWYFGLPGNPVAGFVGLDMIVKKAIWQICGAFPLPEHLVLQAKLYDTVKKSPQRLDIQRVILQQDKITGDYVAYSVGKQDSHRVLGVAKANAYALLPQKMSMVEKNEEVSVIPFSEEFL